MAATADEPTEREFLTADERLVEKQRAQRGENVVPIDAARAAKAERAAELEHEESCDEADPYATLVEPGIYSVGFLGANKVKLFGRFVWLLDFTIVSPGKGFGLPIRGFASALTKAQRLTPSHTLVQLYAAATNRRPPRHLYRLSPAEFLRGALYEARVRTVTRDRRGRERPAALYYSRIDSLERRLGDDPGSRGAGT